MVQKKKKVPYIGKGQQVGKTSLVEEKEKVGGEGKTTPKDRKKNFRSPGREKTANFRKGGLRRPENEREKNRRKKKWSRRQIRKKKKKKRPC